MEHKEESEDLGPKKYVNNKAKPQRIIWSAMKGTSSIRTALKCSKYWLNRKQQSVYPDTYAWTSW